MGKSAHGYQSDRIVFVGHVGSNGFAPKGDCTMSRLTAKQRGVFLQTAKLQGELPPFHRNGWAVLALDLHDDLTEAVAMLRCAQWTSSNMGASTDCCAFCARERHAGHAPDCRLAALLAKYPEE